MSPRTVLYGLRNTRKQATDQQCPRPRPHTTAHWHRMHTSCDRQAAARIPIAFAPGTPALAFPAVSYPEACATPALRPWVIVVWVPVPGRYPTTLNRSGPCCTASCLAQAMRGIVMRLLFDLLVLLLVLFKTKVSKPLCGNAFSQQCEPLRAPRPHRYALRHSPNISVW